MSKVTFQLSVGAVAFVLIVTYLAIDIENFPGIGIYGIRYTDTDTVYCGILIPSVSSNQHFETNPFYTFYAAFSVGPQHRNRVGLLTSH